MGARGYTLPARSLASLTDEERQQLARYVKLFSRRYDAALDLGVGLITLNSLLDKYSRVTPEVVEKIRILLRRNSW